MEHTSHPHQVESAQQQQQQQQQQKRTYSSGPDITNSATLPFPAAAADPHNLNDAPHLQTATMSHLNYQPADLSEADDAPDDMPVAHERPTRGRGRGRGRVYRGKGKIAKPAPTKPVGTGRGRRHKVYESARAQAAHERIQELKSAFATVAKVVKPAAQEIADRSVNELLQDPDLVKKVPEFDNIQTFLRARLADTKKTLNLQLEAGKDMAKHVYDGQNQIVLEAYTVSPTHSHLIHPLLTKSLAVPH
jgi:hypothetical protein